MTKWSLFWLTGLLVWAGCVTEEEEELCLDEDEDGYTTCDGDCDDHAAWFNPGEFDGCNGFDDDCDGYIDDEDPDYPGWDWWPDEDGDGYPNTDMPEVWSCEQPQGHVAGGAHDCDDTNPMVNPGMTEVCNGYDDDCDPSTSEDEDLDGDGVTMCEGDCNDSVAEMSPLWIEQCDGMDTDCDPQTDEEEDFDGDGYSACDGDCDDTDAALYPGWSVVTVPGDFGSIQEAIDGAEHCGRVEVAPGNYAEDLVLGGQEVQLVGTGGPYQTTLTGSGSGPVIQVVDGEHRSTKVRGFTVTGGNADTGGGVLTVDSSPILEGLHLVGNQAEEGGAVHLDGGRPLLRNLLITDNTATHGAGIYARRTAARIHNVWIAENQGGGMVQDDVVHSSSGTAFDASAIKITGNTGGSAVLVPDGWGGISSASIVGNQGPTAAVLQQMWAFTDIYNTDVSFNVASSPVGGVDPGGEYMGVGSLNVYENQPSNVGSFWDEDNEWTVPHFSADPQYLDISSPNSLEWDLHLATSSPLVDYGDDGDKENCLRDVGAYNGAGEFYPWDLDQDGFPEWCHPGPYNPLTDVPAGLDCDDLNPDVYPGAGC